MEHGVSARFRSISSALAFLSVVSSFCPFAARAEDVPPFRSDIIMQAALGQVKAGKYGLRVTYTTMEPHAQIPPHVHQFAGVRYVLEGAITINWKDGRTQTFGEGSAYFEGPGQNHPAGSMAAYNPTDKTTKILLVELVPVD